MKTINLALQGGGAHGAFTWGVLDRILEDDRVQIDGLSGTSAGAMNAVVVANGLVKGGREGARAALEHFWRRVSEEARLSPFKRSPIDRWIGNWSLDFSPGYIFSDLLTRVMSPYQLNPLGVNPLRDLVAKEVDFEAVQACDSIRVFVSATNVETGRVRVFSGGDLSIDAVMASACLPTMYQAVEIDGVPYWDGGFMGNPALFPFFRRCSSDDVVVVKINPIIRRGTPRTARDILNRINEITFNASLLREFRAIDFVSRLLEDGLLDEERYRNVFVHIIESAELAPLTASSKLNAEWAFLVHLKQVGQRAAERWLTAHVDDLGQRSTVNLRALFQTK